MTDASPKLLVAPRLSGDGVDGDVRRLRDLASSLLAQNQHLQRALDSRIVIEQAKGVLAERYGLSVDDAFHLLRGSARSHRLRLHALAAAVVASRDTPTEISPPAA